MGPKKEMKKEVQKRDKGGVDNERKWTIEDSINLDSWRCVVVMAVEKTQYDCFVVEEFTEACYYGRRKEVSHIDFDTVVMQILKDFANGELPYKYTFLLNFSSVFQEAVDYIEKKMDVPIFVLVKVVKALLFYLREENLMLIKSMATGSPDPIKAMAERPANFDSYNTKKKDVPKKGDNGLKVRPPSVTKEDTKLLKRGEKAKDDHCIDDAPRNAYFNLYVLLTGFYSPDFPLELIKANIPLHAILCIDTSLSGVKRDISSQKCFPETKSEEIQNFWEVFLKKIWDPKVSFYFKDTIFQMYTPERLLCEKKKLGEFIYREISYIMYDLSDLKRQLSNYLEHFHLWDMSEKGCEASETTHRALVWPESLPEECVSVSVVLRCMVDAICEDDWTNHESVSSNCVEPEETEWRAMRKYYYANEYPAMGSFAEGLGWSQELEERGAFNLLDIYYKIKELDVKYDLGNHSVPSDNSGKGIEETDNFQSQACTENMEETLTPSGDMFRSYWKNYNKGVETTYAVDYCLYAFLMTKVLCPYQTAVETSLASSHQSVEKNSDFELINNLSNEMRQPHFTVTEGSRSILKAVPCHVKNTSRDFFCPEQFKVVSLEKLKASSAPEFRVTPSVKIQTLYTSETFPSGISKNPFENLRGFLNECLLSNTDEFDFLEFLSKPRLLKKEHEHWSGYNCVDHSYSLFNDCVFIRLHNRKDCQNVHHETFNETLRTPVGLRDFHEYVLEDDANWLYWQEELYQANAFLSNTMIVRDSFRDFADADFWMPDSLKFQEAATPFAVTKKGEEVRTEPSSGERLQDGHILVREPMDENFAFEGYNVSSMAVQFSGLKTVYYSSDSSVAVQLIERLYGTQELGIHVSETSHSLHLYSYVCPEPHILDPFTFHVTYKNGVVIAFGRRFIQAFQEVKEKVESATTIKSKNNSSEFSAGTPGRHASKSVKDEDFIYDMAASLPNGLTIRTVRRIVQPCYIKQSYVVDSEEIAGLESSRLFLPNGNIIKMMSNGTVQILKVDASIITANLSDLISEIERENLSFSRYEVISGEGHACVYEHGEMTSSKKFQVFQNTDMSTNQVFFRRKDGTDYMLQNDGTLCVQFKDGTRMSSSLFVQDDASEPLDTNEDNEAFQEADPDADFVFVFSEIIAEHPDYATVIYDSQTQKWKIILPYDSTIVVEPNGQYFIDLDKQTELKVEADFLRMNSFSCDREPQSIFTANLSVFDNNEGGVYCHMADTSGKIFIVEGNSNCYILDEEGRSCTGNSQEQHPFQVGPKESEVSEFIASTDLQICPPISNHKNNKLLRENKYFVLRRDLTGLEVIHKDDVSRTLTKTQKGSLVFTQNLPGTENRCFVLVTPRAKEKIKKWGVESILPNPKYRPGMNKKTSSTTYGVPPSWMHPYPKRKLKFAVPRSLTCRVFLETQKTELTPPIGTLECYYCEINDVSEAKHLEILQEGVEEYLKKLSNDDQDLLKEIYSLAAASLINEKKKLKATNSKKLQHYLELSRYHVAMREYHERCIKYHIIPNYFHHPAGMCWLIINKLLLLKLQLSDEETQRQILLRSSADTEISESNSGFSNEEIEYNISPRAEQSFSSLSCRSNLSAETAPPILKAAGICKCKVNAAKDTVSSPAVKCFWKSCTSSESNFEEAQTGICEFQENDIEMFGKQECSREMPLMSLEDLMYLGLI